MTMQTAPKSKHPSAVAEAPISTAATVSSVSNSDGTLTISPTTGAVVASLALGHANTWTGQQTFNTSAPIIGTSTAGNVFYSGSSKEVADSAKLTWDNTNQVLQVGTTLNGTTTALLVKNGDTTATSLTKLRIANVNTDCAVHTVYSNNFAGSGVLTAQAYTIGNAIGDAPIAIYTTQTGPIYCCIGGTGTTNLHFSLTGAPSANSGAIAAVQTNSGGTAAYSMLQVRNSGGLAGFLSCASTGYTTAGIYNASSVYVESDVQSLYLVAAASGKEIRMVTGGTGTANIRAVLSDTALTLSDSVNIAVNTSTGTKIGTGTTQKIGFWNATPIVQPTTGVAAATFVANTSGIVNDTATWDGYTVGQVVKALRNEGLLA